MLKEDFAQTEWAPEYLLPDECQGREEKGEGPGTDTVDTGQEEAVMGLLY